MSRASDDPAAELDEQETVLPKLAVGDQVWSPDKLDEELILLALDAKGHQTSPPRALHRSVAGQAARRRRHRPSLDLRADGGDHSAPRLRVAPGQGAGAELHRVCGHAAAAQSLRRLRRHRLHRRNGRDPRQDLERREGLAGVPRRVLSRRQEASRPRASRRGQGPGDRVPGDRAGHGSGKQPAGARAHRSLRSVPAARDRRTTAARARRCPKISRRRISRSRRRWRCSRRRRRARSRSASIRPRVSTST